MSSFGRARKRTTIYKTISIISSPHTPTHLHTHSLHGLLTSACVTSLALSAKVFKGLWQVRVLRVFVIDVRMTKTFPSLSAGRREDGRRGDPRETGLVLTAAVALCLGIFFVPTVEASFGSGSRAPKYRNGRRYADEKIRSNERSIDATTVDKGR